MKDPNIIGHKCSSTWHSDIDNTICNLVGTDPKIKTQSKKFRTLS